MYDLLIRNGNIIDGTGAAAYPGEIGIENGRITTIGERLSTNARRFLDANGGYITPGFIDIHRHADINLFTPTFGEKELRQGLTLIVNGNCGLSAVPSPFPYRNKILDFLQPVIGETPSECSFSTFAEYMNAVEHHPLPLHIGMLIGNGTVRATVKGYDPTPMTTEELMQAKNFLADGLKNGALGISIGLVYAPENCYSTPELESLFTVAGEFQVPLVTHIRGEGDLFHQSLEEVIHLAKKVNAPLHVSHLKCIGKRNWGHGVTKALQLLTNAREDGLRVDYDAYPYTAGSTQLLQILPPEYLEGGTPEIICRLKDPAARKRLAEILPYPQPYFENLVSSIGWENIRCTSMSLPEHQTYLNHSIAEIAAMRKQEPCECVCDLLAAEDCNIAMVDFITCEEDIAKILQDPYTSVISDSVYPSKGVPHPRLYGTYPRLLQKYVVEENILSVEQAIHKITALPAQVYGLKKGLLCEGADADINVFHLEQVKTSADYVHPCQLATGMDFVIINGEIAVEQDQCTGVHPGKLLRRTHPENRAFE